MELGNVGKSSTNDHTRDGENTAQFPVHVYETINKNDIGVDFDYTCTYDQLAHREFGSTHLVSDYLKNNYLTLCESVKTNQRVIKLDAIGRYNITNT